jgi:hypothetical protein
MGRSILNDLGQEVTGIAFPVSVCMALTVILVRILNPEGESDSNSVLLANLYYSEQVRLREPPQLERLGCKVFSEASKIS